MSRAKARPILLQSPEQPGRPLLQLRERSEGEKKFYELEDWMQALVSAHPETLPVAEFGAEYGNPVSVARELETGAGPLDILLVSRAGRLILVEAKLWRNPEARREVVAQVLDYVTRLHSWSCEDLERAIESAPVRNGVQFRSLKAAMEAFRQEAEKEGPLAAGEFESRFYDGVSTSLREGRVLLLVVGDGIRESLEDISRLLNEPRRATQAFELGLVEIGTYPLQESSDFPAVVVPRVIGRTGEVQISARIIIEYQQGTPAPRAVVQEIEVPRPDVKRSRLADVQEFMRMVKNKGGEELETIARSLIEDLENAGFDLEPGEAHLSAKHFDVEDRPYRIMTIRPSFADVGLTGSYLIFKLIKVFGEDRGKQLSDACEKHVADLKSAGLPLRRSSQNVYCDLKALADASARRAVMEALHRITAEIDRAVEGLTHGS